MSSDFRDLKRSLHYYLTARVYQDGILKPQVDRARLLTRLWRATTTMKKGSGFDYWLGMVEVMRSIALATLTHRDSNGLNTEQIGALSHVLSVLHSFMADVMGNSDWYSDMNSAVARLEEALAIGPPGEHTGGTRGTGEG